jgi:low affinity Fe/Cu permease
MQVSKLFSDISSRVAHAAGRPMTFALCVLIVLI